MRFQSQLLSDSEKEQIHKEALNILQNTGAKFHSQKALKLLESNGARIDWDKKIAYIPSELVEQALKTTPSSFVLGARNPKFDYPMPSPVSRFCLDGTGSFAQDFYTGEHRYGTIKDNENGLRIFQTMDMGVMAWPPVSAEDKPAYSRPLHEWAAMMKFCSKHGEHELHTVGQAPYYAEMLTTVLGSEDEVRARHAYSLTYCPVSPLIHDGPMMDAYLEVGSLDVPIMVLPMPAPGMTGPASLFSAICLADAEALSSIVTYQLAHPGRPMIFSSATGTMDMRNGAFLGGTPEMGLMSAALIEMGRYYDLPSTSAGCTADAREPGADAVLEKIITTIPPVLAGSDIILGIGVIESDQLLVLEQIIVDNEIAHFCERIFQGVDSAPGRVLTNDIQNVGPGGNFLSRKSTLEFARSKEVYFSNLLDRHTADQWLQLGKPSMYSTARKKVEEILAGPLLDPLSDEIVSRLDEILIRADRELG
ncbi:MAG: trimethylamine methyltransferase family protein [Anaerolineales bacterium]|nr:trimethylamine methyltransferase family protein [Anaerolineales bacterium]